MRHRVVRGQTQRDREVMAAILEPWRPWVPYVSDPDKWYQHLLDIHDGLVEPDYLGRYIVGSGEKHRRLKEKEAKQMEKQRPVVNLVSPVAQATEMATSEIKRERKKEKRRKKAEIPPLKRKYRL